MFQFIYFVTSQCACTTCFEFVSCPPYPSRLTCTSSACATPPLTLYAPLSIKTMLRQPMHSAMSTLVARENKHHQAPTSGCAFSGGYALTPWQAPLSRPPLHVRGIPVIFSTNT